jgi:hypothetical protein
MHCRYKKFYIVSTYMTINYVSDFRSSYDKNQTILITCRSWLIDSAKTLYTDNVYELNPSITKWFCFTFFVMIYILYWFNFSIILCLWILTSLCWFLTGFDYFLHTWVNKLFDSWIILVTVIRVIKLFFHFECSFANDACSAFEDFEKNPQNSSLGSMLPCINDSFSDKLIAQIGSTIHSFIVEVHQIS